jgi:hypothetical protein
MDKYTKLKEVIKRMVREEMMGEGNKLYALKKQTDSSKGLPSTIAPDDNTEKSQAFLTKYKPVSEMAAPNTVTYALKDDADERLELYLSRPIKDSIKKIVSKMVDILKTEGVLSVGEIFDKLQEEFANDPDVLSVIKSTTNVKGWLWGINSDDFNKKYTHLINPATGKKWESGDLNAVPWVPFVRSKDKLTTPFVKAQQQAITDPEAFATKQASFKQSNTLEEKVIDYKYLRTEYFTKRSQNRADVKIDRTLKGRQSEIPVEKKMTDMLTDELAVALLYQWKEGYLTSVLDEPLKVYAQEKGLLEGRKTDGLTQKFAEILLKLINNKQIKPLSKKAFTVKKKEDTSKKTPTVKKKEKTPMSKDDIDAYYKSIGMDTPDDEKVDLTGTDDLFGDETDDEED